MGLKYDFLKDMCAEYGVKNIRVFMPMQQAMSLAGFGLPIGMTSSDDPFVPNVECEIDESRYKIEDGYKATFKPVVQELDENHRYFANETFYQMDFSNIVQRRPGEYRFYVLVDEDNKYQQIPVSL